MAGYTPNKNGIYTIPLVDLGYRLKDNFGLTIREHPEFDPVDKVHSDGSYHYIKGGGAIDIQDWRADDINGVSWKQRTKNLRDMLRGSGAEVFGPGDLPGHDTHLHLAGFDNGKNVRLNEQQYQYFFGGNSGGTSATFSGFPTTQTSDPSIPSFNVGESGAPSSEFRFNIQDDGEYSEMAKPPDGVNVGITRMAGDVFKSNGFEGFKSNPDFLKQNTEDGIGRDDKEVGGYFV